jgi:hypothetical protein
MAGSQGGVIVRDEEHVGGARLTLEEDTSRDFHALTCVVSDWLVHARFFGDAGEAQAAFEAMKPALEALLAQLPPGGPRSTPDAARTGGPLLTAFLGRFP